MQLKLFTTHVGHEDTPKDLQDINAFLQHVQVKKTAAEFVAGPPERWSVLIFYEENTTPSIEKTKVSREVEGKKEEDLTETQQQMLQALKLWRKEKADELELPEYRIFNRETLLELVTKKPEQRNVLDTIKGIGQAKMEQFGDDVVAILNAF